MVSIVIPVYNVEQFLPQCIDSVLSQTYKDLEIILVDDGSTDSCSSICEQYRNKDHRITVLHKINGGLSDARNAGTKIAHGDWLFYLDADDWITENAIGVLLSIAIQHSCDIVQGNFFYAYKDHLLYRSENSKERAKHILNREEAMRELIINDRVKNFAWGKLYKASIVKNFDFPKGKYFEDSYWQHLIVNQIERYGIVEAQLYYYRQREGSISNRISDRYDDLIEGYKERLEFIKCHYPQFTDLMIKSYRKVFAQKYPSRGVIPQIKRFCRRVKSCLFPTARYIRIEL